MKKTHIATALTVLVLIPLTIFFGSRIPGRGYYLTSTLVLLEVLLPFFLAFEGRKPQARELVVIAVLCALAVVGRVLIPIPHFKATFAVIILSAIAFGPESGFMIGAVSALVSNFFFGQGTHTPWQMVGYGMAGLLSGFAFRRGWFRRTPRSMALFGAVSVIVVVGPLLDSHSVFSQLTEITWQSAGAVYLAGLPVNIPQAIATYLTIRFLGEPLLEKLDRVKLRYGMTEDGHGL